MFVVIEGQDSTCPPLDSPSLKHMTCHARAHDISGRRCNNLQVCPAKDLGHTQLQERTHASSKSSARNKQKNSNCKAFCVTLKRNKTSTRKSFSC